MKNPFILCITVVTFVFSLQACDRTGGTSKAGPSNQTVDSEFRVHRDKDGSVTGEPGVSPYEGRNDQQAGSTPSASPSAKPRGK